MQGDHILVVLYRLVFHAVWTLHTFLAATKQLYEWFSPSVRPSVCLSVRHTFLTMFPSSYHHEIFRSYYHDRSDVHAKGQGQRSKVKVTEVTTQLNLFRTVTSVWIGTVNYSQKHGSRTGEASKTTGSGYRSALAAGCSLLTALYIRTQSTLLSHFISTVFLLVRL